MTMLAGSCLIPVICRLFSLRPIPGNHAEEDKQSGAAGADGELHSLCDGKCGRWCRRRRKWKCRWWQQLWREQQREEHQRGGQ